MHLYFPFRNLYFHPLADKKCIFFKKFEINREFVIDAMVKLVYSLPAFPPYGAALGR